MKYRFCPICGRELDIRNSWDEGDVPYCPVDDVMFFDLPKPCIVVAVLKGNEVLLMKQSYIFKNSKVLVSGYVNVGENVEETVIREVKEETGITINNLKYLGSDVVKSSELLMLTFMANYVQGDIVKSKEVEWVDWSNINNAISEMSEDEIGKAVIRKVLKEKEEFINKL
ncbi:NUDIX domain-containing protein [Clostridium botulinum]|uniref:NAD(+) diphosphatase n=1 Tax=Clostridium botulinum C/D str. DC5 TaxID=1443128 RepID=A0A0A0IGL3_CLOBO|nr:NUDIX domain-containing protein [Clostridium botulinum]KEI04749.1 DNA mismatch repair protein MutT [Clostridium botulinum C/D str. BKT75002]KEI09218.1 DNA mismatch repair protein MutT [Clostridium botulinum C/D str. BKT2873]KGM93026.1 DNA mismatch repair protein MutT [Clostridium botulinum D str. CCUG 7971]KGN00620.1 DNA mismatch repair protein MutT [Clostridium botulinum C/D str. DC5]KOC46667.1 DNA mismatch repair protein MutT [Clostridium botulinum]